MRSVAHWTPRYVRDRLVEKWWLRRHPDLPWFTPDSVRLLDQLLRPSDVVFEWGSGRSTRWFADRAARITSIETDPVWHARVAASLEGLANAKCVLVPVSNEAVTDPAERYWSALGTIEPGPVDVVVVDGAYRDLCAVRAAQYVSQGGLVVVDDVERYLPSDRRSPNARADFASETWHEFANLVSSWRRMWTTSGVTDTAIWVRPHAPPHQAESPDETLSAAGR